MMRIIVSPDPVHPFAPWRLWRSPEPSNDAILGWYVYRIYEAGRRPIPGGTTECRRDVPMSVSVSEIDAAMARRRALGGPPDDPNGLADDVRRWRGDPSTHDWLAWVAPLDMDHDDATSAWDAAIPDTTTPDSHIVLGRTPDQSGWLAWIGLGSYMIPVRGGDRRAERRRAQRHPDAQVPAGVGCRFSSREDALDAAVAEIRPRRQAFRQHVISHLGGWQDEASARVLSGHWHAQLYMITGVQWEPEICVHEGDATSSWDRPIIAHVTDAPAGQG